MQNKKPRTPPDFAADGFKATRSKEEERRRVTPADAADEEDDGPVAGNSKPKKVDEDYFGEDEAPKPRPKPPAKKAGNGFTPKVVSMQPERKLTKKDAERLSDLKAKARGRMVDVFFKSQQETGRKKLGGTSLIVGDIGQLVVTIPMFGGHGPDALKYPGCLPLEFVFGMDGFPLCLVLQLVAKAGVGKSALLAEFGRWFSLADGGLELAEAESKFDPNWYRSIMGDFFADEHGNIKIPFWRCDSVEGWQRAISEGIRDAKIGMDGTKQKPGLGRTFPLLFGVDSIMGKQSEKTAEEILGKLDKNTGKRGTTGKGHADRGFPIEALVITRYLRTIPSELEHYPFALVLVNHLRIKTDDMGNPERSKAGGEQVNFQESIELELKKVGGHKKMIRCSQFEGYPVEISCEKNSFAPTHRKCRSRLLWWWEDKDDRLEQHTYWDWDWGTVHLLNSLMHGENADPVIKARLKKYDFHLECPTSSDIENTAWSRTLGMKDKDDALSWSEVGALIRENPGLMDMLRKALCIERRPKLQGDYLEQMGGLVAADKVETAAKGKAPAASKSGRKAGEK